MSPSQVAPADVDELLSAGLTARDVIDTNQVVAYFNYVTRVAEGLGVELEDHSSKDRRRRARPAAEHGTRRPGETAR